MACPLCIYLSTFLGLKLITGPKDVAVTSFICLCLALSLAAVNSVTVTFMSAVCDCVYSRFIVGIYLTRLNTVVSFTKDGLTSELHIIGCVGGLYKVCVLLRLSY